MKKAAVLIASSTFEPNDVQKYYLNPLKEEGFSVVVLLLETTPKGKVIAANKKSCLPNIIKKLNKYEIDYVLVANGEYFKSLTGLKQVEPFRGTVCPSNLKGLDQTNVVLSLNYKALFKDASAEIKLNQSLDVVINHEKGQYQPPGKDLIKYSEYPSTLKAISDALRGLIKKPELYMDIEAFSLSVFDTGIGSIGISPDQFGGIAFLVDYVANPDGTFKERIINVEVRKILKAFLIAYKGTTYWHGATYDLRSLIAELWMQDEDDIEGLLEGISVMTKNTHCTKAIAFSALNNADENILGLKALAQKFAGNYSQDVKDITKLTSQQLLPYNLADCLCTAYVKETYWTILIADEQLNAYTKIQRDALPTILYREIWGMYVDMETVLEVEQELLDKMEPMMEIIQHSPIIQAYNKVLSHEKYKKAQSKLKVKILNEDDFDEKFNPGSGKQIVGLLHDFLDIPIDSLTKTGQPAVGAKQLTTHRMLIMSQYELTEDEINSPS